MKSKIGRYLQVMLACFFLISLFSVSGQAAVRQADVTTPREGDALVSISGKFFTEPAQTTLNRINQIRKEACQMHYPDPRTQGRTRLSDSDYVPMKWSSGLEMIAQTRAAEADVRMDHVRPNNTICFSCTYDHVGSDGEVLAWFSSPFAASTLLTGVEIWYTEKRDWVNGNNYAVTGHYTAMIDPSNKYIGVGAFKAGNAGMYAVAGEVSRRSGLDESKVGVSGAYQQVIEIPASTLSISMANNQAVKVGSRVKIKTSASFVCDGRKFNCALTKAQFQSSNKYIVGVSSSGLMTAVAPGTVKVTLTAGSGTCTANVKSYYEIQYALNGGKNNPSNVTQYTTGSVNLLNPTKKGYRFAGWYEGGNKVSKVSGRHASVAAKWIKVVVGSSKIQSLRNLGKGQVQLVWGKASGASVYQVQYALNSRFTSGVKTVTTQGLTAAIPSLSAGKYYYFRVRSYAKDSLGNKVFGAWSPVRSLRITR